VGQNNDNVAMWQPTIVPAKSRSDGTAIKIHQPNEKWQHKNEQECRQNQTMTAWQLTIWQSNYVNDRATNDKCASQPIRNSARTNNFVR
jgi:hypothetical protein